VTLAHVLHLITDEDSPTTVSLSITGGLAAISPAFDGILLENYTPKAPEPSLDEYQSPVEEGGAVTNVVYRNVSESVGVLIASGLSSARIAYWQDRVQALLRQAHERTRTNSTTIPRVFVEYQPDSLGTLYRSEILAGTLELDPDAMGYGQWDAGAVPSGAGTISRLAAVRATITWTRRFYWEGPEQELSLHNSSVGNLLSPGLRIVNHDDSGTGDDNYADLDAGSTPGGVLPAPIRLELANTLNDGDATRTGTIWVGEAVAFQATTDHLPSTFVHMLEGESAASGVTQYPASPDTTRFSGGSYGQFSTVSSGNAQLGAWAIDATRLGFLRGSHVRLLARFAPAQTTLNGAINNSVTTITVAGTAQFVSAGTIQIDSEQITYTGTTGTTFTGCTRGANGTVAASHANGATASTIGNVQGWRLWWTVQNAGAVYYTSPQILIQNANEVQELGSVPLPPYRVSSGPLYPLTLALWGQKTGGGRVNVDYVQLTPLDGWRKYEPIESNLSYSAALKDDLISGDLYTDGWGTVGRIGNYIASGGTLMLWPGKNHRFYILQIASDGTASPQRTLTLRAYTRPRVVTL
jgi:hypothetical protein